jgi:hypothetical protein
MSWFASNDIQMKYLNNHVLVQSIIYNFMGCFE